MTRSSLRLRVEWTFTVSGMECPTDRSRFCGGAAPLWQAVDCAHERLKNGWMLLLNDLCSQAIATRRMVLTSSGMQRRDFITLTDACAAIRHLMELPADKLGDGLFNVGGGWAPTIMEMTRHVAARIHAATGHEPEIVVRAVQGHEVPGTLDYQTKKLASTGLRMSGNANIDQEIDGLIQFCLKHFVQES